MSLQNALFDPPYDIHLLRGQTVRLDSLLKIGDASASSVSGLTLTFTPLFKGTKTGDIFTGFNISVDTTTGEITTQTAKPTNEKRNFIIVAKVTLGSESNETYIRIHIHQSIKAVWLSPSTLTVQKGLDGFQFSLRARFDDDIVAEIGNIHRGSNGSLVNYNIAPALTIAWSGPVGLINANTGLITPSAATASHNISVNVTYQVSTLSANGTINIDDQLSGTNINTQAELISTGNCPGFARKNEVPNILFIADGFRTVDLYVFSKIVDTYVSDLLKGKIFSPFDILSGSINFWKLAPLSMETGVTTRGEIYVKDKDGDTVGAFLEYPEMPTETNASKWECKHLYYHFGLPLRADVSKINSAIRTEWKQLTNVNNTTIDSISEKAIDEWKLTGNRRFPEDRDTILGIYVNNYTSASKDITYDLIHFNSKRINRTKLDAMFQTLKDSDNNLIGDVFISTPAANKGKDFDNIVFVTAANCGRAQNIEGGFFVDVFNRGYYIKVTDIPTSLKTYIRFTSALLDEYPYDELSLYKKSVLTHELGHSLGLGDEYGERPDDKKDIGKTIDDGSVSGWNYTKYNIHSEKADQFANIQARSDLLSPDPSNNTKEIIDVEKMKWRYHRIKKCGVVTANPTLSGTNYTITLKSGYASKFATNDKVFVRKSSRNYPVVMIGRTPLVSTNTTPAKITSRMISPELNVVSVNAASNQVVVSVVGGTSLSNDYLTIGAGERLILYIPVPKDGSATLSSYKYAEVISEKVINHIKTNAYAFNTKEVTGDHKEIIDDDAVQNSNIPSGLVPCCSSRKKKIVGIYSGGYTYHGHIYHPTAQCLMRQQYYDGDVIEFCAVCKYILVDVVDPSKHDELDEYIGSKKIYPT